MEKRDPLTTEEIKKKFKSQFDLVNYAIRLAENMIKTGRDPRVKLEVQNRAMNILAEINEGKDRLDDIPAEPEAEEEIVEIDAASFKNVESKKSMRSTQKMPMTKKGRKILTEHASK